MAELFGYALRGLELYKEARKVYTGANRAYRDAEAVYNYFNPPVSGNQTRLALPAAAAPPAAMPRFRRRGMRRRRRFGRRSRRRSGRRRVVSAQAGNIVNTRYHSRRLRSRAWSRALLADTRFKPHYRSLLTSSFTSTTPVGVNAATKTGLITLLPNPSVPGNFVFWSIPGGALPIDNGVAVPPFNDSTIVLRGGRSEVTAAVPGQDGVKLKMYLFWVKAGADVTGFNALTTVPTMWDPSHFPDHEQSFKLLGSHEYIMLPGSRPLSWTRSFRPHKIDWDSFRVGQDVLAYCFTIQQLTDIDALPASVIFTVSHSVSFVADTI